MSHQSEDSELIAALRAEVNSLRHKVKVLEFENAKLSSHLSNCRCQKVEGDIGAGVAGGLSDDIGVPKLKAEVFPKLPKEIDPGGDLRVMHQLPRRYVALKIMYFGQRFYGFASEAHMEPTIESEVFKALAKTRLLLGDKKVLQYSRCGRTDKGVSSVGQVIALFLRSNLKDRRGSIGSSEESRGGEIDYVRILNRVLPKDIRVMGWSPAPIDFSARFSCLSRVYKYYFWRENLNIEAMEIAGKKFIGEHDFRNFCKMDAANVHNYRRQITSLEIIPCDERFEHDQLWAIKIKGSAFLWHQVRCMVAVLFMIGKGHELAELIDLLLDVARITRKPQYKMAPEVPLVLHTCEFEGLNFICSSDAMQALREHLERECKDYKLQATIFQEALMTCSSLKIDEIPQTAKLKKGASHVPLLSRPTEPSYEERRARMESGGVLQRSESHN